jgi:AbrB family looped-hinge helix DNA binding protein
VDDRPGTKIAEQLMTRPDGATMDEIVAATGGPQYNVLKKLERGGYRIRKVKEDRATRYFATAPGSQSYTATLTSKGQVTVPQEVREQLRLYSGQGLKFTVESDRMIVTPLYRRLSELVGILPKPKRTVSLEEMDEVIQRGAVNRYMRAVGRKKR